MEPRPQPEIDPPPLIPAPAFPKEMEWVNVPMLRMDQQRGRPVLVEFWDFCRVNSLRTLPYLKAWHARYADAGLRIVSVHTGGFAPSRDEDAVRRAVERLGIDWPVALDSNLRTWDLYGNEGWPARYLWDQDGHLAAMHYGEGAYADTERIIAALLEVELEDPVGPLHPEDDPEALLALPSADEPGAFTGPYAAGAVWAVVSGSGTIAVAGREDDVVVDGPGCVALLEHARHTEGELDQRPSAGVTVHATCFLAGLAP